MFKFTSVVVVRAVVVMAVAMVLSKVGGGEEKATINKINNTSMHQSNFNSPLDSGSVKD